MDIHMKHLERQYEFYCKHLEYHDSNVFKAFRIYIIFVGVFLAKVEVFYCSPKTASVAVVIVSFLFFLIFFRTSQLLQEFKEKINALDLKLVEEYIRPKPKQTISELYMGPNWKRTSKSWMCLHCNFANNSSFSSCG